MIDVSNINNFSRKFLLFSISCLYQIWYSLYFSHCLCKIIHRCVKTNYYLSHKMWSLEKWQFVYLSNLAISTILFGRRRGCQKGEDLTDPHCTLSSVVNSKKKISHIFPYFTQLGHTFARKYQGFLFFLSYVVFRFFSYQFKLIVGKVLSQRKMNCVFFVIVVKNWNHLFQKCCKYSMIGFLFVVIHELLSEGILMFFYWVISKN